jgi:DNA-binding beta-propeller fold protein YncE
VRRVVVGLACCAVALFGLWDQGAGATLPPGNYTHFETEPVRPLALSPDGALLFALHTNEDRLVVFAVTDAGLVRRGETRVGLRPAALVARSSTEVWVTNLLSDSVSVVDVADPSAPRVVRTLAVGDEPRDIVVAGANRSRVFVATARRGEESSPGVGRADVWVFDALDPSAAPSVVTLFGTKPRALAASADGRRVYAAIFHSGNRTASVDERTVQSLLTPVPGATATTLPNRRRVPGSFGGFLSALSAPAQATAPATATLPVDALEPPPVSRIVRQEGARWLDGSGQDWTQSVPFDLPDQDLFVLDAVAQRPQVLATVSGVGTVLFNMALQPGTGQLWVSNTEARNLEIHEPVLRGRAVASRITRLVPNGADSFAPQPIDLNPQRAVTTTLGTAEDRALGLSQPTDLQFNAAGTRAYVAVFGSRKVAVLDQDAAVLERIPVGFGPGGLALDEAHGRLFVLNHLDASLAVVDLASGAQTSLPLGFDPVPAEVKAGQPFLYDAALSSGRGDQSCASCHVFGDTDGLAWDLGAPRGEVLRMPFDLTHDNFILKPRDFRFHPLKGPMVTQSLRGLAGSGPMHWRGDRFGPEDNPADELASFQQFRPAFRDLLGRTEPISETGMLAFGRFVLTMHYPPNPLQSLDRAPTNAQRAGAAFFNGPFLSDSGITNCVNCHTGPNGTNGRINFEGDRSGQDFKVPQLRNLYEKVGRFHHSGPQVSGFGFSHDGSTDTVVSLLQTELFVFPGSSAAEQDARRAEVAAFILAFDTGMAPAVGRQLTVAGALGGAEQTLLAQLQARSNAGDCELVARGRVAGVDRGWLFLHGQLVPDRTGEAAPVPAALLGTVTGPSNALTFTCVPPGEGRRAALDRDGDGFLDGDERAGGSDPADPASIPSLGPGEKFPLYFPAIMK